MNNLEIIKRLYTAFGEHDTETILNLFAPDIEWIQNEGFPGGGRHVGADAVLQDVFAKFRLEWDNWQAIVSEWLDAGDAIIALGEYRGRHNRTGKAVTAAFAHVYWIRDGRIYKFQQFTDTLKVAEATRDS
ncbi:MAG: nuclear transport factor 2 family protein [Pyrinomonadaceae bacterium]